MNGAAPGRAMTLAAYLQETGRTAAAFARDCGVTRQAIHRVLNGGRPAPELTQRIITVTGGKVDANSFYDIPEHGLDPVDRIIALHEKMAGQGGAFDGDGQGEVPPEGGGMGQEEDAA